MALPKSVGKIALKVLADRRKTFAEYEESCAEWHKQGYRPHYCVHGRNLWVDYDVICGDCENGLGYWEYLTQLEDCLAVARAAFSELTRRQELVIPLFQANAPVSTDLMAWVSQPIIEWSK